MLLGLLHICVVFFVHFLHNHSLLLINPEVLYEEMDSCFVRKKLEKDVLKRQYLKKIHVYDNPEYGL